MNYLIFAMAGFLFLLAIDIYTSRNVVDANAIPEEESRDMFGNREIGEA